MKRIIPLVVLIVTSFNLSSCGGTTTGNPVVTLKVAPYSPSFASWFSLITPAHAAVSDLKLCFKRLRFKPSYDGQSDGDSGDSTNFDFEIGEVTLSSAGSTLGSITLPAGTYRRIEFDLHDQCTSGKSVQVTNSQSGSPFSTNNTITIKFEGTFAAAGSEQTLTLQFQSLVSALDTVTSDALIKTTLENASLKGSF
jgi:hypothetical protein